MIWAEGFLIIAGLLSRVPDMKSCTTNVQQDRSPICTRRTVSVTSQAVAATTIRLACKLLEVMYAVKLKK